jgi:HlyD family secretion protein
MVSVTCLVLAIAGCGLSSTDDESGPTSSTSDTTAGAIECNEREIFALGCLEPAEGVVDVVGTPGDRIERFLTDANGETLVRVGNEVPQGQHLVVLESYELRELEVQLTRSQLKEAEGRRDAGLKVAEAAIMAAELAVKQAKAQDAEIAAQRKKNDLLEKNKELAILSRQQLRDLSKKGEDKGKVYVTQQELRHQDLLVEQAVAEWEAGIEVLKKLEDTKPLAVQAAIADRDAAKANKDQVEAANPIKSLETRVQMAEKQRDQSILTAPCTGTILEVLVGPNEAIGPGPVLRMANLEKMMVVAEVYETDVKCIAEGQQATIISRAFPKPYGEEGKGLRGKVVEIGRIISSPSLTDTNPFAQQDKHVLEVRIELDPEYTDTASQFVHMQVNVKFDKSEGERASSP